MSSSPSILLPTRFGDLLVKVGEGGDAIQPWVIIYKHPWETVPFLRVHSSCVFSESFHGVDCDCALQLEESLKMIARVGGAIVYLYQEGRGLGLFQKAVAIAKQQELNIDTAEAYRHLGFDLDPRQYDVVADALASINFPRCVRLATNNPRKIDGLMAVGYTVVDRAHMELRLTDRVLKYLRSKVHGLGHYERD